MAAAGTASRAHATEDLQLRGYAGPTIRAYLLAVFQLARYHGGSPDQFTEEQIRDYLLHLTNRKIAASSFTQALCGIKFFYEQTLSRRWPVLEIARPKRENKLPVVLSHDEVRRVLAALRTPVYRVCLTFIYACGLRLLEGLRLQIPEIDGERKLVHIRGGKGGRIASSPSRMLPSPCCEGSTIVRPLRPAAARATPCEHGSRAIVQSRCTRAPRSTATRLRSAPFRRQ